MPGALVQRVELSKAVQDQGSVFMVGPSDRTAGKALDLTTHRALAVRLEVEGPAQASGETPVLNLQLETGDTNLSRLLHRFGLSGHKDDHPARAWNQPECSLSSGRPLRTIRSRRRCTASITGTWLRSTCAGCVIREGSGLRCRISLVEALEERSSVLKEVEISTGSAKSRFQER